MSIEKILGVLVLISLDSSKVESNHCNINCTSSPCLNYSIQDVIKNLWKVSPQPLSPNLQEYRDAILCSMKNANNRQMAVLFVQTVRSVHRLMNFDPTLAASCVYNNLVSSTNNVEVGRCGDYIQTIRNYSQSGAGALAYSGYIGAIAAGCDTLTSVPKSNSLPCPLDIPALKTSLERSSSLIPNRIADILKMLIQSPNLDEQMIGQAGIAAAVPASVDYFSTVYLTESHFKVIQLESCTRKIPSSCCAIRKKFIDDNIQITMVNRTKIYDNIIAENIKLYECCESKRKRHKSKHT